jgi:N-acetylglucosamine kinase-like BadF-type ATPase
VRCDFTFLYARLAQVTCIDEEKKVVGEGTSGCTNFNSVGQEKASQHLREAILSALKAAGVPEDQG